MLLYRDYDLSSFNTLALAARGRQVAMLTNNNQLPALQSLAKTKPRRWVLGEGSNMVMSDYIDALIIKVQNQGIRLIKQKATEVIIEAQGGENWHQFVQHCLNQGWYGLENLALIPGTVGASPVQNIGAYGVELDQKIHQIHFWDFELGQLCGLGPEECNFSYRDSFFKQSQPGRYLIVSVQFKLTTAQAWQPVLHYPDLKNHSALQDNVTPQSIFDAVVQVRKRKLPDPKKLANAGSFFKNPIVSLAHYEQLKQRYPDMVAYEHGRSHYKLAAGWLIDQSGWRGKQLGPVGMHQNQALVLVNYGGATADDVHALVNQVKSDIKQHYGIDLEQEPVAVQ